MKQPARRSVALLVVWTLTAMGAVGCGGDGDPPEEVGVPWRRGEVFPHRDVHFEFDRVAVASGADTVAWVTRRRDGETGELAYFEIEAGRDATHVDLPAPSTADAAPVLIPVDVATDQAGWSALAATRDRPNGSNTGLVAWRTRRTSERTPAVPTPEPLRPPAGLSGTLDVATVGRSDGTTAVAALYDGQPVVWVSHDGLGEPASTDGSGGAGSTTTTTASAAGSGAAGAGGAGWEATQPELGLETDLVSIRVAGAGGRLVLAGVDDRARAHLWTSTDGEEWEAVGQDLPVDIGAVGVLVPLGEGQLGIAWLADDESAPWSATLVMVQRLDGTELVNEGVVAADTDAGIDRVDVGGLARSPTGRLVAVGAAYEPSGDAAPMVWAQDGDQWAEIDQPELTGRLDYEFRAVTGANDRLLVGLVTGSSHIDVETWRWQPRD